MWGSAWLSNGDGSSFTSLNHEGNGIACGCRVRYHEVDLSQTDEARGEAREIDFGGYPANRRGDRKNRVGEDVEPRSLPGEHRWVNCPQAGHVTHQDTAAR